MALPHRMLPPPGGPLAAWAEGVGRREGLFALLQSGGPHCAGAVDLAAATGFAAEDLEVWLRVAVAHGFVQFSTTEGYSLGAEVRPAVEDGPWQGFLPPYRLMCDLAVFVRLVPAAAAERWAGVPVESRLGRTPLLVLAARYFEAEAGEDRRPLRPALGREDLYREIACVVPLGGPSAGMSSFPALWLDSPTSLPLDLGWQYGFPKYSAEVDISIEGRTITAHARSDDRVVLDVAAWETLRVPGRVIAALSGMQAVFPGSGLQAALRLDRVERAWALMPGRFSMPELERIGLSGPLVGGLWLEGVTVALSVPAPWQG